MPYDGNPEIKEQNGSKYLYVRKEIAGKSTSKYVDVYSDELYQLLFRNAKEAREINKSLRKINKELVAHGYEDKELSARVLRNLDFARANMKTNIYDQATSWMIPGYLRGLKRMQGVDGIWSALKQIRWLVCKSEFNKLRCWAVS